MSVLSDTAKYVWDFRREHSRDWKTPERADALRYAFSEMGEAYSEWLRLKRPDDHRNRQKDSELDEELADVAIMLITALGESFVDYGRYKLPPLVKSLDCDASLDYIAMHVSKATVVGSRGGISQINIMIALLGIEHFLSTRSKDLDGLVAWKLGRIEARIEYRKSPEYHYLENKTCPYCGADNPQGDGSIEAVSSDGAIQEMFCSVCGEDWLDLYRLYGIDLRVESHE